MQQAAGTCAFAFLFFCGASSPKYLIHFAPTVAPLVFAGCLLDPRSRTIAVAARSALGTALFDAYCRDDDAGDDPAVEAEAEAAAEAAEDDAKSEANETSVLRATGNGTDLTLLVGGERRLYAHRVILACRCTVRASKCLRAQWCFEALSGSLIGGLLAAGVPPHDR